MKTKTKWLLLSLGGLVVVIGALAGTKAAQIGAMINAGKSWAPPPESVTTGKAEATEWTPMLSAIGSVVAYRTVTIASEVPGLVKRLGFESGKHVRTGDVLVELDTSIEEAQLASATAQAALAQVTRDRATKLRNSNLNTQAEMDTAEAQARQAEASVAAIRATIAKKTIRASFDGILGIRTVELGQVLSPGTPVATLTAFDFVYSDFFLPQQSLSALEVGQDVQIATDTFGGETWTGKLEVINPEVDVATRNVKLRARFANKSEKLRPGMFVNVRVMMNEKKKVLIVPATAVIFAPYGDSVFAVEESKDDSGATKSVARQKFVRLGERRGDFVAVESGLEAGATVVTTGAFKLRNGAPVVVNNALAPEMQVAPKPSDT